MGSPGGSGTTSYKIPKWQQNIVKPVAQGAYETFQGLQNIGPYTGEFIADPAQQQREALAGREAYVRNLPELGAPVMNLGLDTAEGKYLDLQNNPYFMQYLQAAVDPVLRSQERAHRVAGTSANAQGAYGGSREAILQGEIMRQGAEEAGNISGRLAGETYGRERVLQQNAPELIRQGLDLGLAPSELLYEVGERQRGFNQDDINEALRQYQEQFEGAFRPYYPLTDILGRLGIGAAPPSQNTSSDPTGLYKLIELGFEGGVYPFK